MKLILKTSQIGILFILFIMSSCSQDLNRTQAKKAIIEKHHFPFTEIREFDRFVFNQWDIAFNKAKYEKLRDEGYISFSECNRRCVYFTSTYCTKILEKGKPFISGQPINKGKCEEKVMVRISNVEFVQIEQIKKFKFLGTDVAEVVYTTKRNNISPFGKILFNIKEGLEEHTQHFVKYDDGWKIEND